MEVGTLFILFPVIFKDILYLLFFILNFGLDRLKINAQHHLRPCLKKDT